MGAGRLLGGAVTIGICGHMIHRLNKSPYYNRKKKKKRLKK